ncbi:hypothetical protein [Ensifer aridi]|uniref:hypothetical protein n=1 Tax=Ensifer aridi TaxID=1708715 RepID=UPI000A1138C3|nr:hypothetical protein [Ensifer aridi]
MNAEKMRRLIEDCRRDLDEYLEPDCGISDREIIIALLYRLDGPQARDALGEEFDWRRSAPEGPESAGANDTRQNEARLRIILNRRAQGSASA